MRLYSICHNCKTEISFWTWNSDRVQFKMSKGDWIKLNCKSCGQTDKYKIDDLKAKESKISLIIALIILLVGTPILFLIFKDYMFKVNNPLMILVLIMPTLIPSIIFGIIQFNDKQRVRTFNRS